MEKNKLERYEKQYRVEIDSYRESGKTDDEIYKFILRAEKKLQINKVENLIKVLQKSPDSLSNIKALMDYRSLRTLQISYRDILYDYNHGINPEVGQLKIDAIQIKFNNLEMERRNVHNKALGNFCGLMRTYRQLNIPPFYIGEYMDPHYEKNNYGDPNIRRDMTDSMFSLLNAIEDVNILELQKRMEQNKEAVQVVDEMRKKLNTETRSYKIRFNSDEDDIERI